MSLEEGLQKRERQRGEVLQHRPGLRRQQRRWREGAGGVSTTCRLVRCEELEETEAVTPLFWLRKLGDRVKMPI